MDFHDTGIIDTHCHLWQLELARQRWIKPEMTPLYRTFEPADLAAACAEVGVVACVLIEAGRTEQENRVMGQMAGTSPLIAGFVPFIDLESSVLARSLDQWMEDPKFRGVRMGFEGHPDPDILKRPSIMDGLKQVAERELVFEFLVLMEHLPDILKICDQIPDLRGVIEHLGKPDIHGGSDWNSWREAMIGLAANTGLDAKLSLSPAAGLRAAMLANPDLGWPIDRIKPFVQHMLEQFGPGRLMWGSDWPVARLAGSYSDIYHCMCGAVGKIDQADQRRLFRKTAQRVYGLTGSSTGRGCAL